MSTYCIKTTLMNRDGMTEAEALVYINRTLDGYMLEMEEDGMQAYDDLEELLREEFGLEPDYMMDLLDYLN